MAWASLYDSTVPATFRVVVDGDIVPGSRGYCKVWGFRYPSQKRAL